MDERDERSRDAGSQGSPGMIQKAASIAAQEVTEAELKAINKYTLEPLKAEDVFTFKAVLCDNEIDRQYERFTLKALQDLQKLFQGKTVIKDHYRSADNQVARIYSTELAQSEKATASAPGELYTQLVAHCYMVRTASNADLIAEIKGGIKREGSVGCSVTGSICSICGTDNTKTYCPHWPGRSYAKEGGQHTCTFALTGGRDAYEFSLVAVPVQRAAGVSKSYTGETIRETADQEPESKTQDDAKQLSLRARLAEIRANTHKNDY